VLDGCAEDLGLIEELGDKVFLVGVIEVTDGPVTNGLPERAL
jgi:hypothetical protein